MKYTPTLSASVPDVDLERARELLSDEAVGLSDDQVIAITRHADAMARVVVETYLAQSSSTVAA